MKKLILLLCLFAATITQAQTKEETIDWLNLYSQEFLKCKRPGAKDQYAVKVDVSGKVEVEYRLTQIGDNRVHRDYFTFQAKDIVYIDMPSKPSDNNLFYLTIRTGKHAVKKVFNDNETEQTHYVPMATNSYEDLNRVYKALVRYAGFFGYKEKVSRDTF